MPRPQCVRFRSRHLVPDFGLVLWPVSGALYRIDRSTALGWYLCDVNILLDNTRFAMSIIFFDQKYDSLLVLACVSHVLPVPKCQWIFLRLICVVNIFHLVFIRVGTRREY